MLSNCPLIVACESIVPVAATAGAVNPVACAAVIVGVCPATVAAVIDPGVAAVC